MIHLRHNFFLLAHRILKCYLQLCLLILWEEIQIIWIVTQTILAHFLTRNSDNMNCESKPWEGEKFLSKLLVAKCTSVLCNRFYTIWPSILLCYESSIQPSRSFLENWIKVLFWEFFFLKSIFCLALCRWDYDKYRSKMHDSLWKTSFRSDLSLQILHLLHA